MNAEDQLYNEIERFIKKEMSLQEHQDFEGRLHQDSDLSYKVRLQSLTHDLAFKHRMLQVKAAASDAEKEYRNRTNLTKYGAVGAILLVAGLAAYLSTESTLSATKPVDIAKTEKQQPQAALEEPKRAVLTPTLKKAQATASNDTVGKVQSHATGATLDTSKSEFAPLVDPQPQGHMLPSVPEAAKVKEAQTGRLDCDHVVLKAHIHAFHTCEGANEGSVSISQVQGGQEPYKYQLFEKEDPSEKGLSQLPAGQYRLVVTDHNKCKQEFKNIIISSKPCDADVHFNPSLGETWQGPVSHQSGVLYIYSQSGQIVYQDQVSSSYMPVWDGKSKDGTIESGVFVYLLKYSDGTQKKGNITILQ